MRAMLSRLTSQLLGLGVVSLALMATSACKPPEYPLCKKDKHCKQELGETCIEGTCQNCKTDAECTDKAPMTKCHEFRCQDPSQIEGGAISGDGVGAPCVQTAECVGGLVCKAGSCQPCTEDFDCSPGTCNMGTGRCDAVGGGGGGGQCTTDDECAMDEICDGGMCVFSGGYADGGGESPCSLDAVYFGFDSPKLQPEAQSQLTAAAECMTSSANNWILEAHADSRGTEEYNIMLTDRRGQGVKDFLVNLGVPSEKMQVISKGSLVATATSEAEMSKDRRVQFLVQ